MIDTAKVRAEWADALTPMTYPGEGNAGKTWGPYSDDIAGWAVENVFALLDALDEANVKLIALLNMVPEYAYIQGDDRLVVLHDDMCAVLNGEKGV